jgi:predicted transcriptional regulator
MELKAQHTKLERYLKAHDIKPASLARASGYSRQHLLRVRKGRMEPTRPCIVAITTACRHLANEQVSATDLFEIG